jgi:hypothetical protein
MAFNLNSISKSGSKNLPPRIVIHGPHGIGKTTFAASAPKPIFIPTEDGLVGVNIDSFPVATEFKQVKEALAAIAESEYKTIVIDSADWLEALIHTHTSKENGKDNIEAFGYGKGYVLALQHWRELFKILDWYRTEKGMTVIFLSHSEIKRFDSPEADSFDRYFIKLHKAASALMLEWADIVGFANWAMMTKETDTGFGNKRTRGLGTGERILYLEERPSHIAKSRYQLPARIPLTWSAFSEALQKSQKSETQTEEI